MTEIVALVSAAMGPDKVLDVRLPSDEMSAPGILFGEALKATIAVNALPEVDFIHVPPGSTWTFDGTIHVVPSVAFAAGDLSPQFAAIRARITKTLITTGRMRDPQFADQVLAAGNADLVGMTRAIIRDPEMPTKAREGRAEDICYCIACNQACVRLGRKGAPLHKSHVAFIS